MLKHFVSLEIKSFFRSASFGKGMVLKILMVLLALWMIVTLLATGLALYPGLKQVFPDQYPFVIVNNFVFYWFLMDLFIRFFFQKLPVMAVKPLLLLPVKRRQVVNYVLGKSALSFFNFLHLFIVVPFGFMLVRSGHDLGSVIVWGFAILLFTLIVNFLNFIIESLSSETELSYLPILVLVGGLFVLNYFNIVSISGLIASFLTVVGSNPLWSVVPLLILALLYAYNFKLLKAQLYLDHSLKTKVQQVEASTMAWTRHFGDTAPFIQMDLKLIWRNKRPRSSAFILVIGLVYGLFFYPNPDYANMPWFYAFIGIFVTGIFLINFGQFIPAWDSGYYKMLMAQNIKYEQYLRSKYVLMTASVIVLFVLSIPYVYFGWKILLAHFAAAVYNVGINTHVMLFGGSFNRKKIDLNQRAAFNYQGTGAVQWIIGFPLMFLPLAIFGLVYFVANFEIACVVLIVLGLIGIVFHEKMMGFITSKYLESKYKMIDAFSQDS
ncbi:DUF5687 family protein [Mangrovimonas xylaniphaga]|uniref:DUF5687 family protein n=1 Tax=Mangrovimonas xylaniphaga TaxID=1645915 RepID=UPI0006B441F3|nr:DUF5687 family protein [Mangrovimonas xylaniphaga]